MHITITSAGIQEQHERLKEMFIGATLQYLDVCNAPGMTPANQLRDYVESGWPLIWKHWQNPNGGHLGAAASDFMCAFATSIRVTFADRDVGCSPELVGTEEVPPAAADSLHVISMPPISPRIEQAYAWFHKDARVEYSGCRGNSVILFNEIERLRRLVDEAPRYFSPDDFGGKKRAWLLQASKLPVDSVEFNWEG